MSPEASSFGVGPSQGSMQWFSNSTAVVSQRACFFDDEYIFSSDGTFQNVLGTQTWLETWQSDPDGCGTPVAPHNGSNPATWAFDSSSNTLTITGVGAYMGLPKAYNGGELSNPADAPNSITYIVSAQTSSSMTLDILVSGGNWWRFKLTKSDALPTCNDGIQNGTETGIDCGGICTACPESTPPAPDPTIASTSAITIYSDSGTLEGTAVPVNTFRTGWSGADLTEVSLSGNNTLKYTNLGFVGIEATSNPIDASNMNGFHLDVYTPTATTFAVKLVDFGANGLYGGGDDREHQVAFSTQVGWNSKDLLLSSFTGLITKGHIAQIILVGTGTAYVDNIYFKYEEIQIPTTPLVAAPTPPARNAWDVISFFSDAYTNLGADFNPYWGQSTIVTQEQIQGNATMKYANLNYQGVQFNAGANVANMTKLHIDVWTPNAEAFEVFLIGGGENGFTLFPTQAGWNSFDIDMTNYAARTLTNIIQFKFVGTPFGSSTIFYDNLYFWRPESSLPPPTITSFTVPSKFVGDEPFELTAPTSDSNGAFSYTSSNTQVATIEGNIVTIIAPGTTVITATQEASSNYGSGTITASLVVSFPPPATAAPTPTISSNRVLSVFSDAYTNVANTNFFPYWGQNPTVIGSTVSIDNNSTLKYERLSYQGIQLENSVDVSDMTTLHLDMWTPNCTSFEVYLINPGIGEQKVTLIPSTSGWNSFDIALSEYTNIALNNVGQFKFVAAPGGSTVYLDNIYFSKPSYVYYVDLDGDGYDNGTEELFSSTAPQGYATATLGSDCDDTNAEIHTAITYYVDADGDGFGSTTTASLCETTAPAGYATSNTDCDDEDEFVWQTGDFYVDTDGDTYGAGSAVSLCYGANTPSGYAVRAGDCNNSSASVNPGATEICGNSIDDNCNGQTDEGCGTQVQSSQCGVAVASFSTNVLADLVTGATQYRFEVSRGATVYEYTNTSSNFFRFSYLTSLGFVNTYATTYSVRVKYFKSGVWSDYGNSCNVITPDVPLTKVQTSQCGITLASLSTQLTADAISGAQAYRFEVTNGSNVRTFTTVNGSTRTFRLTDLTGGPTYATTYAVRVAVMYNDVWTSYGTSCNVTTPALPLTSVQVSQCGVTLSAFDTPIYATSVIGVTGYKFEVTNGATVRTYTALNGLNYFNLTQLTGVITYSTVYSIKVSVLNNGEWSAYGSSCNVTTPDPLTKIAAVHCGTTAASSTTRFYVDAISGNPTISAYRFQVIRGSEVREFTTANATQNYFRFSDLGVSPFGTSYLVKVAVLHNGVWRAYGAGCTLTTPALPTTKVQASQCGTTLSSYGNTIFADAISNVSKYRFEITNTVTGAIRVITTANGTVRSFKLTDMSGGANFGTTYAVRVAVENNGNFGPYGVSCNLTTPALPLSKVQSSQCGIVGISFGTKVYADIVAGVTKYKFEVTRGSEVGYYETTSTTDNFFQLANVSGITRKYATAYTVRVAVMNNGLWSAYGTSCNVTTSALPLSKVQSSQCGATLAGGVNTTIFADAVSGVEAYRFEVANANASNPLYFTTSSGSINSFKLRDVVGFTGVAGSSYRVKVALLNNGVWSSYGSVCNVTLPGTAPNTREIAEELPINTTIFAVKGYPNPYNAYFTLSLDTPSDAMVYVRVFDMTGKLIEDREVAPSALESLQLGADWASGVYNVIVAQDDQVKTVRMVKKE